MKISSQIVKKMAAIGATLTFLLVVAAVLHAETAKTAPTSEAMLKLGERMYREGILPSGEPMKATVSGDVPVSGTAFTCSSCHLRSGLGSIEGSVVTPPATGKILYQPRGLFMKGFEEVQSVREYSEALHVRPAYTDESLAEAIAGGVDSAGRQMDKAMPLYDLSDKDMAILINYLKSLSAEISPGISKEEIRFATVITDGVSQKDIDAMLAPLHYYIARKNAVSRLYKTNPLQARMAVRMMGPDLAAKRFTLAQWRLKGSPDTWRTQLDAYYKKAPVFALLGGISSGEWLPIHQFCEDNHLPCLFPSTDFPVRSAKEWYTIYFSKGIYQEGGAAARYLNHLGESGPAPKILQIVRDTPRGEALAAGFNDTWASLGHKEQPVTVTLQIGETWDNAAMRQTLARQKPAALLLWDDGAGALPVLDALAGEATRPKMVFVSNSYFVLSLDAVNETAREFTYISYPYRVPHEDARYDSLFKRMDKGVDLSGEARKYFEQSYSAADVMSRAIVNMRGEYYRDFFLDTIDMMGDQDLPLYERLSFGPGQRYAVKGCYIVKLGHGQKPELIKQSEWFVN